MSLEPSRRHPARPILAASIAVFRDGRVLLAERERPPAAGCFSLPGGLVELGETLEDAVLRELREETGVVATVGGFCGHVEVIGRDADGRIEHHFVVASFWGRWITGEPVAGEDTRSVLWADPDALAPLPLTPGLGPLLVKAAAAQREPGRAR